MAFRSGRHFLQIPGPTNVPDRVLRAIDQPTIDHRGPEFAELTRELLAGLQRVFRTSQPVIVFPSSGTGAWEAALVNTLSPGDKVLMCETGHFATLWKGVAENLGLRVEFVPGELVADGIPIMEAVIERGPESSEAEIRLWVAEGVAKEITETIDVPTIGIGASAGCDGQILVTDDMLGLFDWTPKFVRRYADLRGEIGQAVARYADDVRARRFPGPAEIYFAKAG